MFGCAAKRFRLALNQAAYGLFQARTLALIFVFGDGPGLMAQFEPEHAVFQFVHAAADFAMNVREIGRSARRHGRG